MGDEMYVGERPHHACSGPRGRGKRIALAVLAAGSLAACGGQAHQATTGGDPDQSPTASQRPPITVEEITSRPYTALGTTQFAGREVSASMIRGCGHDAQHCDAAVLLTQDGWATHVAHLVPGASWVWTWLQPDGSVAFVPDAGQSSGVLHPDGSITSLQVSTEPTGPGEHSVLTAEPPLLAENPASGKIWALDTVAGTLRPLSTSPSGHLATPPITASGATFVTTGPHTGPMSVATVMRTADRGETWDKVAVLRSHSRAGSLPGGLIVGPGGRMAYWFSTDGATIAPLVELWTSTDSGRSWTRMRPSRQPRWLSGMAYAPDGTLLMVEESGRAENPNLMWRTTADGTDLEPAPDLPVGVGLNTSGGVLYQETPGGLLLSEDGASWTDVHVP